MTFRDPLYPCRIAFPCPSQAYGLLIPYLPAFLYSPVFQAFGIGAVSNFFLLLDDSPADGTLFNFCIAWVAGNAGISVPV